jgi:hypothetical protein
VTPWLRFGGRNDWRLRLEFKPADLWIGAFIKRRRVLAASFWDLWVCLIPMLPIHFAWDVPAAGPGDRELSARDLRYRDS